MGIIDNFDRITIYRGTLDYKAHRGLKFELRQGWEKDFRLRLHIA